MEITRMRRVDAAFQRLRVVAFLEPFHDKAITRRDLSEGQLRELGNVVFGAHVGP